MRTPSIVSSWPVCVMYTVGAMSVDRAGRRGLPEPGAHAAPLAAREGRAVHVRGAAAHRRAGVDVLGDRVLEESLGGDHRHAAVDLLLRDDALDAAEVVDVASACR